mmetsp:Transcript_7853/g.13554  ORF Transcript_7853/g.13554 Transcript_7853/m.13554 type:complete len:222 (-) Transcript_7853:179-844(-)
MCKLSEPPLARSSEHTNDHVEPRGSTRTPDRQSNPMAGWPQAHVLRSSQARVPASTSAPEPIAAQVSSSGATQASMPIQLSAPEPLAPQESSPKVIQQSIQNSSTPKPVKPQIKGVVSRCARKSDPQGAHRRVRWREKDHTATSQRLHHSNWQHAEILHHSHSQRPRAEGAPLERPTVHRAAQQADFERLQWLPSHHKLSKSTSEQLRIEFEATIARVYKT